MKKTTAASLLAAAALLAAPAAGEAHTVGSDFTHASSSFTACGTSPCTLAWTAEGWFDADLPQGSIVTSWSAKLSPNAKARLRILRRNGDGTFTGAGTSEVVTGSAAGGVQTFTTHLAAPDGQTTIGVDVVQGAIGYASSTAYGMDRFEPSIADGATRPGEQHNGFELLASATYEADDDGDGKGDATEDDCLWTCPAPGGDSAGGGSSSGGGSPAPEPSPAPTPSPSPSPSGQDTKRAPDFAVGARALPQRGAYGDKGWFDVFVDNGSSYELDATITVRAGSRALGTDKITELDSGDDDTAEFRLTPRLRKQFARAGKLKLSLTATATLANGTRIPVRQALTLVKGGDRRYDGTWRGPGPFVLVVDHGAVRSVSASLNAFCPKSNRFQMLSLFAIDGFPALVGRDGSFSADGSAVSQAIRYNGKLALRGPSKGYASVYKAQMNLSSDNRFYIDACQGATNWTVTRATR